MALSNGRLTLFTMLLLSQLYILLHYYSFNLHYTGLWKQNYHSQGTQRCVHSKCNYILYVGQCALVWYVAVLLFSGGSTYFTADWHRFQYSLPANTHC